MDAQTGLLVAEPLLRWLGYAGLMLFAISGALLAMRLRLDIVAACFFAIVAAAGGGTVRDVLIGAPVFWLHEPVTLTLCIGAAALVWMAPSRIWHSRALDWFDAAGLAAFAVYGTGKALNYDVLPLSAIVLGLITACLGGICRDVVANVPSIMLRNELYVTAAVIASALFAALGAAGVSRPVASLVATTVGFVLRGCAIRWGWSLPRHPG